MREQPTQTLDVAGTISYKGKKALLNFSVGDGTVLPQQRGLEGAPSGSEVKAKIKSGEYTCHSSRTSMTPASISSWICGRKRPWCADEEEELKRMLLREKEGRPSAKGKPVPVSSDDAFATFSYHEKIELLEIALADEQLAHQHHIATILNSLKQY